MCVSHLLSHPIHPVVPVGVRKAHKLLSFPDPAQEDSYKVALAEMGPVTLPSFIGMLLASH